MARYQYEADNYYITNSLSLCFVATGKYKSY